MNYISTAEAAKKWGVFPSQVRRWLASGRIPGAKQFGSHKTAPWMIPKGAKTPKPLKPGRKSE